LKIKAEPFPILRLHGELHVGHSVSGSSLMFCRSSKRPQLAHS
jgi:hypothetical protein